MQQWCIILKTLTLFIQRINNNVDASKHLENQHKVGNHNFDNNFDIGGWGI